MAAQRTRAVPDPKAKVSTRREGFNGLTPQEWTAQSRNVWSDLSSPRGPRQTAHGAVFPVKLADRVIRLFSGVGDLVIDPFAGIGTTLIAARRLRRPSLGIELSEQFVASAAEWLQEDRLDAPNDIPATMILDDCRNLASWVSKSSVQLTVTSPPYANFIRRSTRDREKTHKKSKLVLDNNSRIRAYSDDVRDLGNMEYEAFLAACRTVLQALLSATVSGGYAVWVVKDHRLPPKQPYVSLHSDLATIGKAVGWLWHDLIVWDQNEQRSLVLLGYPTRFYTNQNCSFLVVLRKP